MSGLNDEEKLVSAALAGDKAAFGELVKIHQRKAVAVAGRLLSNMDDSLEVVQDAFVRAYQSLGQLSDRGRFGAWLMRIVVNQALNYRRKRGRHRTVRLNGVGNEDDGHGWSGLDPESREPGPEETLAARELAGSLQEAIYELPDKLRTALLLFTIEKLPQKEIADIMKCSSATVKWSVFEARRRLKKRLGSAL